MLKSGMALDQALTLQARQEGQPRMKGILESVQRTISQEGVPLSAACTRFPRAFPHTVRALMEVGENSGNLAERLEEGARMLERQDRMARELSRVLIAPCLTLACCSAMLWIVIAVLVPRLDALYRDLNLELPPFTVAVLGTVRFICQPVPVMLLVVGVGLMWWHWALLAPRLVTATLRFRWSRRVTGQYLATAFCNVLGHLYQEGIALSVAMELLVDSTSLPFYRRTLTQANERFQMSGDLATALEAVTFFPPTVSAMIRIGQETGRVDRLLLALAKVMEEETEELFRQVVTLLEPCFMVVFGTLLGVLFVSLFLPIYGLLGHLEG
jgi:type IV pilus assembly protein PilC